MTEQLISDLSTATVAAPAMNETEQRKSMNRSAVKMDMRASQELNRSAVLNDMREDSNNGKLAPAFEASDEDGSDGGTFDMLKSSTDNPA